VTSDNSLQDYVSSIDGFYDLQPRDQAIVFCYYISEINGATIIQSELVKQAFLQCRIPSYSRISQFLSEKSDNGRTKGKNVWFLKVESGYIPTRHLIDHVNSNYISEESEFISFELSPTDWKPSDIPNLTNSIRKNAIFFTKIYYLLYHVENSVRRFLTIKMRQIHGHNWEAKLVKQVDLQRAEALRKHANLSELIPDRGDSILYYCLWDDYGKVILANMNVFQNQSEANEIVAHLYSISKIRNGVAHNMETIPKEFLKEMEVFVAKVIRLLK
jgi:hypothetical protein